MPKTEAPGSSATRRHPTERDHNGSRAPAWDRPNRQTDQIWATLALISCPGNQPKCHPRRRAGAKQETPKAKLIEKIR